ncbi:hypothetical protein DTO063F5_3801 [Paecilomyces variotii]|nr:hypothetical protein DTO063F5_3801 [Paecilomyces variotii]
MAFEKNDEDLASALSAALAPGSNILSLDPSDYVDYWRERARIDPEQTTNELKNILENLAGPMNKLENLSNTQRTEVAKIIKDVSDKLNDEQRNKIRSLGKEQKNKLKGILESGLQNESANELMNEIEYEERGSDYQCVIL